jgi:diguanylate cyclase (GGDEF)-like protein/PAS domain S-box-containing protein
MKNPELLSPLTILLVEDDEHDRIAFCRALRVSEIECEITECVRADDALDLIRADASRYDLVVVDHHLPGLFGVDFCKNLLAEAIALPLVMLTGSGSEAVAVEALKAGVDDYVIKDPECAYLQMLPRILSDAVSAHRERMARTEAEKALIDSQERLAAIVAGLTIPTFVIDAAHIVTHWNEACQQITGVLASEVIGTQEQWRAFYSSMRPVMADLIVTGSIENRVAQHYGNKYHRSAVIKDAFEAEDFFPHLGKSGKWLYFTAAPLKDSAGRIIGAIETLQDVTDRKLAEEALRASESRHRELSITDSLTGLYNSRHFFSRAAEEVERSNRYSSPLSLILLDVDNFKRYNDTYGHLEGDHVLAGLAGVIRSEIRGADSAYRYGGEEFIVIFPETEPFEAMVVAERLRAAFESTVFSPQPGEEARTSISIGGGRYQPNEGLTAFVKRVDEAMYLAKKCGKNRVVFV